MNPKELRIGNYINPVVNGVVLKDEIHVVDAATLMMIDGTIDGKGIKFRPIPVTEDRLRKLGFKETDTFLYLGNLSYDKIRKTWQWFGVVIFPERLRFVHQLQNFVYSVDRKEL